MKFLNTHSSLIPEYSMLFHFNCGHLVLITFQRGNWQTILLLKSRKLFYDYFQRNPENQGTSTAFIKTLQLHNKIFLKDDSLIQFRCILDANLFKKKRYLIGFYFFLRSEVIQSQYHFFTKNLDASNTGLQRYLILKLQNCYTS